MIRLNVFIQAEEKNYDQVVTGSRIPERQRLCGIRLVSEQHPQGCPDDLRDMERCSLTDCPRTERSLHHSGS